jgi:hypothetical protein
MSNPNRPLQLILVFLFLALPVAAQPPKAVAGPNVILSPFNFWSNPRMGRFYNPATIKIGSNFFLYVHGGAYNSANGGPGSDCATSNEQILIFETPNTRANLRSAAFGPPLYCAGCPNPAQGPWTYQGHANPCSAVAHHYQLGSVFSSSWDGQYKLLMDETDIDATGSATDWSKGDFKRILLQTSSDGIHWAPQQNHLNSATPPLLAQSTIGGQVISVGEASIVQGASEWWGTFAFGASCDCGHGRIRVFQNAANMRGFVAYIWSTDSQWHMVGDDGTFSFMPADMGASPYLGSINIISHLGQYQAWGTTFTPTQALDPFDNGCNDGNGGRGAILTASIQEGTADTVTPPPPIGTPVYITSSLDTNATHSLNWPLATLDSFGRLYPVRFDDDWGKYLLYSSSLDGLCWAGLITDSSWRGMEILLTVVDR